jgi:FlaA1/EpsC-like NDP-sugar epimerase
VIAFDLITVVISFVIAYVLRYNFNLPEVANALHLHDLLIILPAFLFAFWYTKSYAGIIRHSTTKDVTLIIFSLSVGSFVLVVYSNITRNFAPQYYSVIPYSVIIIQFAIASLVTVTSRLLIKGIYNEWFNNNKDSKNVMIFGAGRLGQITRNALKTDNTSNVKIIGYIDDNPNFQNKRIAGVPIFSPEQAFEKIVPKKEIKELIIAIDKKNLPLKRKREIVEYCQPNNLVIKEIPSVSKWLDGKFSSGEIKKIQIEDLLGRDAISFNNKNISVGVKEAVVLVTGAAGSIGSEIVRQLIQFKTKHVILLDKAESDLYDLQTELDSKDTDANYTAIVGDVTNEIKLRKIFEKYSPSVVINAAAYKHVPLMEEFPGEAIRVNIGGTKLLANLSLEFGVNKFVLVSTDKAVNPTNVMGATKRVSEIYIQSLAQKQNCKTQFITTRFGNVLGSNGSVIPLFKKQIENGGPVTVTHEDITRFFMTIPEACLLVLEACFMAKGGEIFVFDMGEPIKIYNLAEKMIYLSGFIPHEDIKIKISGLRPGEKLFEEVLKDQEDLLPTHNDKILIGKTLQHDHTKVNGKVAHLLDYVDIYDNQVLVDYMRDLVPEFHSQNSYYNNKPVQEDKKTMVI